MARGMIAVIRKGRAELEKDVQGAIELADKEPDAKQGWDDLR